MTRKVTIGDQEVYVLSRIDGATVVWWGNHRIEVNRHELNELASAFAAATTTTQETIAA